MSKFAQFVSDSVVPPMVDAFGELNYTPTERQAVFHEASRNRIDAILYGGAAGGGKSCAFLMDAIWHAANIPGIKIGCFRRSYPELEESFLAELARRGYARDLGAKWNATKYFLKFPNGSIINFSYAENLVDASRILGGEYQAFYIDEASLMMPAVIQHIEERLRSGNKLIPVIGLRLATNPGGVGHKYLKDRFINPTKRGKETYYEKVDGSPVTRKVVFIQAKASDNPHLNEGYDAILNSIPDPQRRAAMRDGDWDAMVGQFFEQWQYSKHVVRSFQIPKEWQRYAGIDYGYAAPFATVWLAADQDGRIWVYRELYVTKVNANDQARLILEAERSHGENEVVRVADPSMWGHRGTPLSIADIYGLEGCGIMKADNDRINGWSRVHQYLNDGPACEIHRAQGMQTCPMLHVFEDKCPMFIETIPALPRSSARPDDCETRNVEDHIPDALRYVIMAVGTYARPVFYDEDPMFRSSLPHGMIEVRDTREDSNPLPMFGGLFVADDNNIFSPF
jgi:Terminase large subunit, T4likevirus-type, N-terminal